MWFRTSLASSAVALFALSVVPLAPASDQSLIALSSRYASAITTTKHLLLIDIQARNWSGVVKLARTAQMVMRRYRIDFSTSTPSTSQGRRARLLLIQSASGELLAMQQEEIYGNATIAGDGAAASTATGFFIADDTKALRLL